MRQFHKPDVFSFKPRKALLKVLYGYAGCIIFYIIFKIYGVLRIMIIMTNWRFLLCNFLQCGDLTFYGSNFWLNFDESNLVLLL